MRTASIGFAIILIAACSAQAQESSSANDLRAGHQLASMLCGTCHVAAPDQPFTPILNPPAPPFASIVQRKDFSEGWLQNFLTTTHRGLDEPNGMPNPYLADYQVKQVVAYMMSLHK